MSAPHGLVRHPVRPHEFETFDNRAECLVEDVVDVDVQPDRVAVIAERPVVLERVDGHALVATSKAMELAKVTSATAAPMETCGQNIASQLRRSRG